MSIGSALKVDQPSSVQPPAAKLRPSCVCIDIETPALGEAVIHKLGAYRPDTGDKVVAQGDFSPARLKKELDALAHDAAFVLGHNIRRHDLPVLAQVLPGVRLPYLPVIDTLELSPLAFPQNPYHHLVKDYKLVSDARNHPLRDAELSFELFLDINKEFGALHAHRPHELALLHYLVTGHDRGGLASLFERIRRAPRPASRAAAEDLRQVLTDKVCATRLAKLAESDLEDASRPWPVAYAVAWLRVSGGNSVLPPWVLNQFPDTPRLLSELRERPCGDPRCGYCRENHHPETLLERYFNLKGFRAFPPNATGGSLQRDVTVAGLRDESLLAVLPTGAGKSICYQLPALAKYWRAGKLTVVISPLQSLMKDQVDNLVQRGITCAVALNGLLTPPERRQVLDSIRLGEAGIVLVSPEQFRNRSFVEAIKWRQIGAWIFDEAHCLSRWGHDFRTDYLYVSRFIRERFGKTLAPIACFTATAKPDVIADLRDHFKVELGIDLKQYVGSHERINLDYEVVTLSRAEKPARILDLLQQSLSGCAGGAIVFASTRKNAETIAEHVKEGGWACEHFHAGLAPGTKRQVQQDFISGTLRVIVATNAFGMGVDKKDVRLVLHADIPGSLENYLQEAGRAGRDGEPARCVLLYDEEDIETQFGLSARSRLTHSDFAGILRALRKRARRCHRDDNEVVVTARELLLDDEVDTGIDPEARDADTKVKTAVAWLEKARLLQREENRATVFPASLRIETLEQAEQRLAKADLPDAVRERYLDVVRLVMSASSEDGISTDDLLAQAGVPADECFSILHRLEALGILANDLGLRAVLRKGVKDPSDALLDQVGRMEQVLVDLMAENAPDAAPGDAQVFSLRPFCEAVRQRLTGTVPPEAVIPERLIDLIRVISHGFGENQGRRAMIALRKVGAGEFRVYVKQSWSEIRAHTEQRRAVAGVILRALLDRVPKDVRSADAIVECKAGELQQALASDMLLASQLRDPGAVLQQALLYLHETGVLILDKGRTVFRSAMTIRLLPRDGQQRFLKEDFEPLERHYAERNFQIHVMNEYATRGARKIVDALALVAAYFSKARERFVKEHFSGRKELLQFATTAESYRRIVESLRHPIQQQLVQAKDTGARPNRLVLAGPGSGKTKVIVHRVAYLLRILRVAPDGIIVLTFNRSAAVEVRQRLRDLVGSDAAGVAVLTYHAMALRLTGASLSVLADKDVAPKFDAILKDAVSLLEGKGRIGADADELRDRLLRGYRYILVDEYQDINELQYRLVSALAGRTLQDSDAKLTIMAVGDDDQNVYTFNGTSVDFIRRFEKDYEAQSVFLVENYRSTQHIITAANAIIQGAPDRMKVDAPIRRDEARTNAPLGGRWESLDPVARGLVQIFRAPADRNIQAQLAMSELARFRALDVGADWAQFAVIARTHATLEPIRTYCDLHGIPYRTSEEGGRGSGVTVAKTREGQRVVRALRRRSGRLVRSRALLRWATRMAASDRGNPWLGELLAILEDFEVAVGGGQASRMAALEWLYEAAGTRAREAPGHLNLCTAHAAKGREFRHVVVLDAGDWKGASPEEQRLLYVAMTRAKETLTLFQGVPHGNRLLPALDGLEAVRIVEPKVVPMRDPALDRIHRELTLGDVNLGFAGRQVATSRVHRAIAQLRPGDSLQIVNRELRDGAGRVVGRLSQKCQLPQGKVETSRVSAIVRRSAEMTSDQYRAAMKVPEWEVVLAEIVFA